ncbi:MAG TPA: hypothetical protein VFW87_03695 [Pirellulales bacterium]|nr:hypothetical protein [Pirellulales bacterium]
MRRLRDLISFIVLLALTGVCAASLYQAFASRAASARQLDRPQLTTWLLTRDVGRELFATRLRLARRLMEDLREGHDWQGEWSGAPPEDRDRLRKNVRELAGVWIVSQAARFARLPEAERADFLDQQLGDLMSWPVFGNDPASGDGLNLASNTGMAIREFEIWSSNLPPEENQCVRQLLSALYVRWLQQGFQRFLPGEANR